MARKYDYEYKVQAVKLTEDGGSMERPHFIVVCLVSADRDSINILSTKTKL